MFTIPKERIDVNVTVLLGIAMLIPPSQNHAKLSQSWRCSPVYHTLPPWIGRLAAEVITNLAVSCFPRLSYMLKRCHTL